MAKAGSFYSFILEKEAISCEELTGHKNLGLGGSLSKESEQSLDLGQ